MKKAFAFVTTLLLVAGMAVAQPPAPGTRNLKAQTSKVALNPQPLPPGSMHSNTSAASKVELNPQPLPPAARTIGHASAVSKVALNPQPLPPGAK